LPLPSVLSLLGPIVVDGSNVALWRSKRPRLSGVWAVIIKLLEEGVDAEQIRVVFDYGVPERATDKLFLRKLLRVLRGHVYECPPGVDADDLILEIARDEPHAVIVSNDRFLDKAHRFGDVILEPRVVRFELVRTRKGVRAYLLLSGAFLKWASRVLAERAGPPLLFATFYAETPAFAKPSISTEAAARLVSERIPWAEETKVTSIAYVPTVVFWVSSSCRSRKRKTSFKGYYSVDTITGHVTYLGRRLENCNVHLEEQPSLNAKVRVVLMDSKSAAKRIEGYLAAVASRVYKGKWHCRVRAIKKVKAYLKPYYRVRYTIAGRRLTTYVDAITGEVFGRGLGECWSCHKLYPEETIYECPFCGRRLCPDCASRGELTLCDRCGTQVCSSCAVTRGVLFWRKTLCPACGRK